MKAVSEIWLTVRILCLSIHGNFKENYYQYVNNQYSFTSAIHDLLYLYIAMEISL